MWGAALVKWGSTFSIGAQRMEGTSKSPQLLFFRLRSAAAYFMKAFPLSHLTLSISTPQALVA